MLTFEKGSSNNALSQPVICVMVHNEEKNIARTLQSILEVECDVKPIVKVYANGCTDNTHQIVCAISIQHPSVELIEIKQVSKANAWNIAFKENSNKVLIFSDADVLPGHDAVKKILKAFNDYSNIEIACCELLPNSSGLNWEKRFTGFMLIPLQQDFLFGSFYGIRRSAFLSHFQRLGMFGLPSGIVGDDAFLDSLVTRDKFVVVSSKVKYQPPDFSDYCKFLARMKWQSEQMELFYSSQFSGNISTTEIKLLSRIKNKIAGSRSLPRLLVGVFAAFSRVLFIKVMKTKIDNEYQRLGPVTTDGSWVLSRSTRSSSVK